MNPAADDVFFTDENGYFWTLNLSSLIAYQVFAENELFTTPDCSGPSYLRLDVSGHRNPRLVWRRSYDPTPLNPTFFAFPDAVSSVVVNVASLISGSGVCQPFSGAGMPAYAMADAFVVERPVLTGYVLPIHAERAQ